MSEVNQVISQEYQQRLEADYGADLVNPIIGQWQKAALPHQPGQDIAYVRLNSTLNENTSKSVLFIPGFTGGIVANAPFAAAMAARGHTTVLPDQNRTSLIRDPRSRHYAPAYNQALNMAAVINAEELTDEPLNVVTHSYGSLIFDELTKLAAQRGWSCFSESKVAMLAPAGVVSTENYRSFMPRYLRTLRSGSKIETFTDDYHEADEEMFVAGKGIFMANKMRALHEGHEIVRRRLDVSGILEHGVGQIALVPFAEDELFSNDALFDSVSELISERVTSFSPVSLAPYKDTIRGGRGADHSDQQFNPERVAGAVDQFLKS